MLQWPKVFFGDRIWVIQSFWSGKSLGNNYNLSFRLCSFKIHPYNDNIEISCRDIFSSDVSQQKAVTEHYIKLLEARETLLTREEPEDPPPCPPPPPPRTPPTFTLVACYLQKLRATQNKHRNASLLSCSQSCFCCTHLKRNYLCIYLAKSTSNPPCMLTSFPL